MNGDGLGGFHGSVNNLFFRDDDLRLLILIVASSFIIISMMVVIGVVSCILLCFEDTLHDEEELVEHILQVNSTFFKLNFNI